MIMLLQSGSFFVMELIIILEVFVYYMFNKLATYFPQYYYFRLLGIKYYDEDPLSTMKLKSLGLLLEGYFDMAIAVTLNWITFFAHPDKK